MNKNARFRSNLELSGSRSASVAQELLSAAVINPRRISISGFGDTQPLDSNETANGRAKNRRVEIVIQQGLAEGMKNDLELLEEEDPDYYQSLELENTPVFKLDSNEIF
jgi:chemotaxis protein MotB